MFINNKVALITGGKRIGAVIATTLAKAGVDVALVYNRSLTEAAESASAIKGLGRRALLVQADVTSERADATSDSLPESDVAAANVTLAAVEALGARIETKHLITSGYLVADELRLPRFRRLERRTGERFAADLFARE